MLNSFHSSRVVPTRTRTPAAEPAPMASMGDSGRTTPSTTGVRGSPLAKWRMTTEAWPSRSLAAGTACSRSTAPGPGSTPIAPRNSSAMASASAAGLAWWAAPDWAMALVNRPLAAGSPSNVPTLMAPADSPKAVTSSGSPPKAAMLSRTHSRARTWSRIPLLP